MEQIINALSKNKCKRLSINVHAHPVGEANVRESVVVACTIL